ncbi:MAG: endonuclease NucS domain-containing protein [Phocaeicola sp.]
MSKKNTSIKQLVIDEVKKNNGNFPNKEDLELKVLQQFPGSKWKSTHYAWYKSKIKNGYISIDSKGDFITEAKNQDEDNSSLKEFSLGLEQDLKSYLSLRLDQLEVGLELVEDGIEYKTEAGLIDLLAKDKDDNYVVIELKAGKAKDSVIGQTLGYIGALSLEKNTANVRGLIVASDFDNRLLYASRQLPNVRLIKYGVTFSFDEENLV